MSEKSPHPHCKLCGINHPLGGPHAWDKPSATKDQRLAIADAVVKAAPKAKPKKPISSNGRTPGLEKLDAATIAVSASDAGDAGSNPAMGTSSDIPKRGRGRPRLAEPKSPRADYQRELMRKRYAKKQGKPD